MVFGFSSSKSESLQSANAYLNEQFSGSCNVSCQNIISNVQIDLINTNLSGGIKITQSCAADANCTMNSFMNATADVLFKAQNSSNASNPGWFNIEKSSSDSQQSILENIVQTTTEDCDISSLNVMNDVTVFAANSNISGGIAFQQAGSATGTCALSNSMTAAAYASGIADNTSASGKKANKIAKKQSKSAKFTSITYIVIGIVIIIGIVMISKAIISGLTGSESKKKAQAAAAAYARTGCPGGVEPILDPKTHKPVIDPRTQRPVCPPPPMNTGPTELLLKGNLSQPQPQIQSSNSNNGTPVTVIINEYPSASSRRGSRKGNPSQVTRGIKIEPSNISVPTVEGL